MEGSEYQFYWPGLINALPAVLIFIILPVWLLILVFRQTKISLSKKILLIPACILGPYLSTLVWPLLIWLSGIIKTSPNVMPADFFWVATDLLGDWSEYVWGFISTIAVFLIHRSVVSRNKYLLKYLLTPFTMFLWYLTTYYGLYIALVGILFMFSIHWLLLVFGYTFLVVVIFWIIQGFPSLLRYFILKLYGINWFSCIIHALAGIIGFIQLLLFFAANPPEIVGPEESFFFLKGMWELSPVRTIFLAPISFVFVISVLWSTIISPIKFRISREQF